MSYTLLIAVAAAALLVGHLIPRSAGPRVLRAARLPQAALWRLRPRGGTNTDYDRRVRLNDVVLRHAASPQDAEHLLLATADQVRRQHGPRRPHRGETCP